MYSTNDYPNFELHSIAFLLSSQKDDLSLQKHPALLAIGHYMLLMFLGSSIKEYQTLFQILHNLNSKYQSPMGYHS